MKQLELEVRRPGRGGPRGGGRPSTGKAMGLPHRERPFHEGHQPVHVTWRFMRGLPPLRLRTMSRIIGTTIRGITAWNAKNRTSFRVIQFSIQPNHLHMIVEAGSKVVLARGLRGLGVWIARRLNAALDRRGAVLADRYHARALTTPRDVRNALVYVLQNHLHHRPSAHFVDEHSSARWFDGWEQPLPAPDTPSPVAAPQTCLARRLWRRHGLIRFDEGPRN